MDYNILNILFGKGEYKISGKVDLLFDYVIVLLRLSLMI